jgi:hypothetical protein
MDVIHGEIIMPYSTTYQHKKLESEKLGHESCVMIHNLDIDSC